MRRHCGIKLEKVTMISHHQHEKLGKGYQEYVKGRGCGLF